MKKNVIRLFFIFVVLVIAFNCFCTVFALDPLTVLNDVTQEDDNAINEVSGPLENIYGTIFTILKIAGVAGIIVNGVRYMYAGPNDKAEIKQSLIIVIVGTILVFSTSAIVNLVKASAEKDILNVI